MSEAGDPLTMRQCEIVEVIDQLTREQGRPPALRDIGGVLALEVSYIHHEVCEIAVKGGLSFKPGEQRTIQLTHYGRYQAELPVCEVHHA